MPASLLFGFALALLLAGAAVVLLWAVMAQPLLRVVRSQPPAVDVDALRGHVRKLSVDFYPRSFEHRANLAATAAYIEAQLRAAGAAVSVQEYEAAGDTYRNIVARFGPEDGALLVIGAHYDSFDATPGADDNASGVAGLIELARLLAREPQGRPIELVAYTLEEPPFFRSGDMGSARHAHGLREQGRAVELMFSLEMIGYFDDRPGSQAYPLPGLSHIYSDRGDFIALVGGLAGFGQMRRVKALMRGAASLRVLSINAPAAVPGIDLSDHRCYWAEGFAAIMVTDTSFFRNRQYHLMGDTWDKLDYARMAQVVQGMYAVARGL
jgi:Zn-dependent M28 family amino/carboxypeptidase